MTTPLRMTTRLTAPRLIASLVICACLALPGQTWAEETATGIVSQTAPAQAITAPIGTATRDRSAALRRVVALRQELQVLVKALARLVAYQKELLALAKTSDVDAVLRARRARQTCLEEINAAALCDALSVSFTGDDPPDNATVDATVVDDPTMDGTTLQYRGDGG